MGGGSTTASTSARAFLIKDNHVALAGSVSEAVRRTKAGCSSLNGRVEVDNLANRRSPARGVATFLLDISRTRIWESHGRIRRSQASTARGISGVSPWRASLSCPVAWNLVSWRAHPLPPRGGVWHWNGKSGGVRRTGSSMIESRTHAGRSVVAVAVVLFSRGTWPGPK